MHGLVADISNEPQVCYASHVLVGQYVLWVPFISQQTNRFADHIHVSINCYCVAPVLLLSSIVVALITTVNWINQIQIVYIFTIIMMIIIIIANLQSNQL